jgi:hypothetical protein
MPDFGLEPKNETKYIKVNELTFTIRKFRRK